LSSHLDVDAGFHGALERDLGVRARRVQKGEDAEHLPLAVVVGARHGQRADAAAGEVGHLFFYFFCVVGFGLVEVVVSVGAEELESGVLSLGLADVGDRRRKTAARGVSSLLAALFAGRQTTEAQIALVSLLTFQSTRFCTSSLSISMSLASTLGAPFVHLNVRPVVESRIVPSVRLTVGSNGTNSTCSKWSLLFVVVSIGCWVVFGLILCN